MMNVPKEWSSWRRGVPVFVASASPTAPTSLTRSKQFKPHWPGPHLTHLTHLTDQRSNLTDQVTTNQIIIQIQINEEILRVWWHWPPTAPAWSPSSAPDSLISLMLAFRWIIIIIVIRDVFEILSIYANIYIVLSIHTNIQWLSFQLTMILFLLILNDAD